MSILKVAIILCCASAPLHAQEWIKQERIDVRPDGQPSTATSKSVLGASISDDGRWVIFDTVMDDLVAGDTNTDYDVFARDRSTQTTLRLSMRPDGTEIPWGDAMYSAASGDGRFITFNSEYNQLVAGDTNSKSDVFLLDRDADGNGVFDETGTTTLRRVSTTATGGQLWAGADKYGAGVSDDGQNVAFATLSSLTPADNNSYLDVYVRDFTQQTTPIMSLTDTGLAGSRSSPGFFSRPLRMSNDGRHVAFHSSARNLVPGDTNTHDDVFVHDRDSDANGIFDESGSTSIRRASLAPDGSQFSGDISEFDLDATGHWVAFGAMDNGTDNNPNAGDIYLSQLSSGTVTRINFDKDAWKKGNGSCCGNQFPLLSRDAGVVLFRSSQLYSLPGGVTGSPSDVFSWTRGGGLTRITDFVPPTAAAEGKAARPIALSSNGKYALISTNAGSALESSIYFYSRNGVFAGGFEAVE